MKKLGRPRTKESRYYMSMLVNPQKKKEAVQNCKEKNTTLPDEMQKFFYMIKDGSWWLLALVIVLGGVLLLSFGKEVVQWVMPSLEQIDERR